MSNPFWLDKRVFVTGCAGFLGSWLTAKLQASGADVVGLIRDRSPQSELVRSGTYNKMTSVKGDVTDYQLMERILAEYEIDTIFHLAAQTIVGIANRAPLSTFDTNIKGTWIILEAARRVPTVKSTLVASSYHAYGQQAQLPYREDAPLLANHPYDVSKSSTDLIARAYSQSYGMSIAVTRCANLYGGGDLNWNRLVPGTVRSVLRQERPLIRSDGTFSRDYLFVEDAVAAYFAIAQEMHRPEICGQAFNFGMDRPITVLEMVETIIGVSDCPKIKPVILNKAKNEVPAQYLTSEKAHQLLDWQPQYNLEEGLRKTITWYRDFLSSK